MTLGVLPDAEAEITVYIHWPFCAAKCPYCDFNSHVRREPPDEKRFAAAFARELASFAALVPGRKVTSIFFGGGTPSLMAPATVASILDQVAGHWAIDPAAEVTLEANPSSVEAERFRGYREAGVNRVSLGVQSLHDDALKALGRIHNAAEARRAIEIARSTFPRLSFDLIYARPQQSLAEWSDELTAAIDLAADHLSLYQLTVEAGTPFERLHAAGKLAIPDGELAADFYSLTQDLTADRGLPAYEISNHAVPGAESRHNLTYWRYGDYVGVGPGAHGRLTHSGSKWATTTEKMPETWLRLVEDQGHGMTGNVPLMRPDSADEMLLMGLRIRDGVDPQLYAALRGRPLPDRKLDFLLDNGFLQRLEGGRLSATPAGWLVLDRVVSELAA